ncbi:unnamed protein product, partial [marine sediment metagenome]
MGTLAKSNNNYSSKYKGRLDKQGDRIRIKSFYLSGYKLMSLILCIPLVLMLLGCNVFEIELFGKKFGRSSEAEGESSFDEIKDMAADDATGNGDTDAGDDNGDTQNGEGPETSEEGLLQQSEEQNDMQKSVLSMEELRFYFSEAMKHFGDGSYIIAEYYLNKIKDDYLVLQDHIFYYMAKSLLMQEKFIQSEEYYLKTIQNFPDSIWMELAALEIADLYYLQEDYISAEEKYSDFLSSYPE